MENNVHIRFQCCSQPLRDKLKELGFEERNSDSPGFGLKQVRKFYKNNLDIEDSYNGVYLYATIIKIDPKGIKLSTVPVRVLRYHGLSVNKELLENFALKGIYNK